MKEPIFKYEDGHAICIAEDKYGRVFKGVATCHEDDKEFESQLTGYTIAEYRAQIAAAKTYRNDLRMKLSALKQLYYSMKQSTHFNPESYENKMLQRQIRLTENDLSIAKHQIAVLKVELYEYLLDKKDFHEALRKTREK